MASTPAVITTAPPTKVRRKASLRARMTSLPGRRIRPSRAPGGDGGIRTLDRALQPYNGLANRRLQPLGHVSGADNRAPTYARRLPPLQAPGARAWRTSAEQGSAQPHRRQVVAANAGSLERSVATGRARNGAGQAEA